MAKGRTKLKVSRRVAVASLLKRAGQMSEKRFTHFKASAPAVTKRKKEHWL